MLSRAECCLCSDMIELLEGEGRSLGLEFSVVDVDNEPELQQRFGDVLPVLLRDGLPVAKVRLDRQALVRLVRRSRAAG